MGDADRTVARRQQCCGGGRSGGQDSIRVMATILALVAEGLGVTIAPELSLPVPKQEIVAVRLNPTVRRRLGLAVRSAGEAIPAVDALLHLASEMAERFGADAIATSP